MDSQTFITVNGVIIGLVVLSFYIIRKGPRPPVRFDLRGAENSSASNLDSEQRPPERDVREAQINPMLGSDSGSGFGQNPFSGSRPPGWDNYRPRGKVNYSRRDAAAVAEKLETPPREKPLNVMFNWNGHSWDAYEVLGVPAGSSMDAVIAAYERLTKKSDPESLLFIEAAYRAIQRS